MRVVDIIHEVEDFAEEVGYHKSKLRVVEAKELEEKGDYGVWMVEFNVEDMKENVAFIVSVSKEGAITLKKVT